MPWYDTGRTKTGRAFNGHRMEYRVLELRENGKPVTEDRDGTPVPLTKADQLTAVCTDDCQACAGGESLPDW